LERSRYTGPDTGPVTGQPRLTGYAGFRGFGERRLLFDLDRAALAWTHRNRGLDRATTNDNYLAGALVRWWVKVAAVATAGPLKAHEPIAAGIDPQSHREEEAKLVELPSLLGESLLHQLVPVQILDADIRIRSLDVPALRHVVDLPDGEIDAVRARIWTLASCAR
jgi:hypothetical protein